MRQQPTRWLVQICARRQHCWLIRISVRQITKCSNDVPRPPGTFLLADIARSTIKRNVALVHVPSGASGRRAAVSPASEGR